MNMKDIAKLCNVSISTVSRVINDKPGVNSEIRAKVKKVIEENNFRPNVLARNLIKRKSNTIGIIIPTIDSYFTDRIDGISDFYDKYNYQIMISKSKKTDLMELFYLLAEKQVEGILFFPWKFDNKYINKIKELNKKIPILVVDQEIEGLNLPAVLQDNYSGTRNAIKYFIEKGKKNIGFISGPDFDTGSKERLKAYKFTLFENDIINTHVEYGNYSIESGYKAMKNLLSKNNNINCVFSCNDNMAIGALKYLSENNIKVPQEFEIIGFDDIEISKYIKPSLSTIHQDHYSIGYKSAELLYEIINNDNTAIQKIIIDSKLIHRESTEG